MKKLSDFLNKVCVKNASPSKDDDGSMIEYWEKQTGRNLRGTQWTCPKCEEQFSREELDGAHVVYVYGKNTSQFITPLCQGCNRGKDEKPFWVEKADLVPAP